jgi:glutathione synthase/RimK-type ligase-like ATP-grasp enzyme
LLFQAIKATKAIGLDFSGVDIALDKEDNVCVFECNSAPWLSGRVAEELANQIKKAYPL